MPNRLASESSPYLLQHKDNPVDWYAWSDEAFAVATEFDRPIFLSIGYSTCHWCHVMEHESFEDDGVAQLMNDAFVCIKVDREERPDIDNIYMNVCQLMGQHCGWPLNVLMTPDRRPFMVGTYFPKDTRGGRIGMTDLVPRIADAWKTDREKIEESASNITAALGSLTAIEPGAIDADWLQVAQHQLGTSFDRTNGGFGSQPKFPSPHNLLFLLRRAVRAQGGDALHMVTTTLDRMCTGGIHDHVGGGFHRYSTDSEWRLPHFEKMLYDQAMLALAFSEAFHATGYQRYKDTAYRIIEYVTTDLQAPNGLLYAAEDADSEGVEGKFYVWTADDFVGVVGNDKIADQFDIRREGNFADEATRELTGENVLHMTRADRTFADSDELYSDEVLSALQKLAVSRSSRIRPGLDTKILTDWNALMAAALAVCGRIFNDEKLVDMASVIVNHITAEYSSTGRISHLQSGRREVGGLLDDYSFTVLALLEVHQATFNPRFLQLAIDISQSMESLFSSGEDGGFYFTSSDAESLIVRTIDYSDGALPSGNSISAWNGARLYSLTGDDSWLHISMRIVRGAANLIGKYPSAYTAMLIGIEWITGTTTEVVVVDADGSSFANDALLKLRSRYSPFTIYHLVDTSNTTDLISDIVPYVRAQVKGARVSSVFICEDFACQLPITRIDLLPG